MSARHRDALIADMRRFCDEVIVATSASSKQEFVANPDAIRAMERRLELIGEVATRLEDDELPDAGVNWQDLRGLRVMLAHIYHRLMPERLWAYATTNVQAIRDALA